MYADQKIGVKPMCEACAGVDGAEGVSHTQKVAGFAAQDSPTLQN